MKNKPTNKPEAPPAVRCSVWLDDDMANYARRLWAEKVAAMSRPSLPQCKPPATGPSAGSVSGPSTLAEMLLMERHQQCEPPVRVQRIVSRRLTSKQWDDVADLCNEAAVACETGYEDHDWQSRQKAAKWMMALAMKAQGKAASGQAEPSARSNKKETPANDRASDSQKT